MTAAADELEVISRRSLVFGALFGAAGLAAISGKGVMSTMAEDPQPLDPMIPRRIGSWRQAEAGDLILPADAPKSGAYDQELQRIYVSGDAPPMMLVIAYCARPQQGLLQIHDPRVCYPAAGFELEDSRSLKLPLGGSLAIDAQSFVAVRPGRTEQVSYWMRVGDAIKGPTDDQHIAILGSVMRGSLPDGLLLRISSLGEGAALANEIGRFARALVGALPEAGREFLLGRTLAASWSRTAAALGR